MLNITALHYFAPKCIRIHFSLISSLLGKIGDLDFKDTDHDEIFWHSGIEIFLGGQSRLSQELRN